MMDFLVSSLHSCRLYAMAWVSATGSPVHSAMLSIQLFFGLPLLRLPSTVPYNPLSRNAVAIESEAKYPFGGNVYYVTMQITLPFPEFSRIERNLHCDVLHIRPLPPIESPDSFWMTRSQRSRRRDKGISITLVRPPILSRAHTIHVFAALQLPGIFRTVL